MCRFSAIVVLLQACVTRDAVGSSKDHADARRRVMIKWGVESCMA